MRILFVNPPYHDLRFSRAQRSPGVIKSGTMYYPYWLAHAAALAQAHGHEIDLVDCAADGIGRDELLAHARGFAPELVVVETSTPSYNFDLGTVAHLKAGLDEARFVMVGTHVTAEWRHALTECPALDFVAVGEYDYTIVELAKALETGGDVGAVAGLAYRDGGALAEGPVRAPIEDMDALPWIAPIYKRFLKPENYLFTIATHPMVMLIGGRGCRAKCFFCVYPQLMHGHRYRTRSPAHVVGEMKWIQENMPEVREIVFEDDTFTSDAERAREIARLVRQEGVTLPWFANIRTNIDRDTLSALHEAGLRECATGFESGDQTILNNMRKGQTVERQRAFMRDCRDVGILVHGCFMVGFPGETRETLKKTLDLAIELSPDSAQFYPVMPYPGTGAFQWAKENGFLNTENFDDWLTGDGGHRCVIDLPGLPAHDLERFCESAFRRFHFRPRYILRKLAQAVTDPREGRRSINAGVNFLRYLLRGPGDDGGAQPSVAGTLSEDWYARTRVPYGRMEKLERAGAFDRQPET
jgi:radical SAM superfamily enzyme YgiQ (UPF0313 family)